MAILAAYSSAFHAARAILFNDGYGERSHFAIYEYLKEKHPELGEVVAAFDAYRRMRHAVAYGIETVVNEQEAKEAINFANKFLHEVKGLLKID